MALLRMLENAYSRLIRECWSLSNSLLLNMFILSVRICVCSCSCLLSLAGTHSRDWNVYLWAIVAHCVAPWQKLGIFIMNVDIVIYFLFICVFRLMEFDTELGKVHLCRITRVHIHCPITDYDIMYDVRIWVFDFRRIRRTDGQWDERNQVQWDTLSWASVYGQERHERCWVQSRRTVI